MNDARSVPVGASRLLCACSPAAKVSAAMRSGAAGRIMRCDLSCASLPTGDYSELEPCRDLRLPLRVRRRDLTEVRRQRVGDDRAVDVEQQIGPVQQVEHLRDQLNPAAAGESYGL